VANAKEEILARIQRAAVVPAGRDVGVPVDAPGRARGEIVDQFAEFAAEYRANVVRVGPAGLHTAIKGALAAHDSRRVVIASDLASDLRPEGVELIEDDAFGNLRLDEFQAVITTCAVAVAETGTVVLDAGPGQGKRAISLIPDHHLCVVFEDQVVDSVPEAVALLAPAVLLGRPLTWISGPSATSDIELDRVEGVHGPRILDILLAKR
jgi:L-lactate dehydrogenase complex protein LldG